MSAPETAPATRLDAVNVMLSMIGQLPLSSLLNADTNPDALVADTILTDTLREVQEPGWHWNTDKGLLLTQTTAGEIVVPNNTIAIDTVGTSMNDDLVQRAGKLYDRVNHTFVIGKDVYVDLTVYLSFEDMPPIPRRYCFVVAGRKFAVGRTLASEIIRLTQKDENRALVVLLDFEGKSDDRTMVQASPHIQRMRRGYR